MPSSIVLRPQAAKFLNRLRDLALYDRLRTAIDGLANDPYPRGCVKLAAAESLYRIRVGDYRIIYQVHEGKLRVLVVDIGHRREIYR